ncbi:Subtilase family protein [Clostridium sp. DSM 8431]|uniref:S8 family peptidase n=1 Tax=Clostridium sp. DSM 8431 TaxID=1761781 RepID=UPI0008E579A2|nr:S8 family peptidase [Clostridium sp. DSM 8431]SFU45641.1 Subtilase family protein [Clostridium sp. DSM 8431]
MENKKDFYLNAETGNYLVIYRGEFKEQIDKLDYATGDVLTNTGIGVISLRPENLERLLKDVPSIVYVDFRMMYALGETMPSMVGNINHIKINPYLDLNGLGVTVGIIDTGVDYLNKYLINEDGTSRITKIWDQSIPGSNNDGEYIGRVYRNEEINRALESARNNQNPYNIVQSRDTRNHGTRIATIIGGRGENEFDYSGIAPQCNFIVVKLLESEDFKLAMSKNGINDKAAYNVSEVVAALEFMRKEFFKLQSKAMVVYLGVGATEGSHDGKNLISQYVDTLGAIRGMCFVTGAGNEGDSSGHRTGFLRYPGDTVVNELSVPREIENLTLFIWVERPDRAAVNVVSPNGESSSIIQVKINRKEEYRFVFTATRMKVTFRSPDPFTGNEVIIIEFKNLKPGIWRINLVGSYVVNGRFDIWLPPHELIPEGLKFLEATEKNTVTIPSTAINFISVSYYGEDERIVASSGKGILRSYTFKEPSNISDVSTLGVNIAVPSPLGIITGMSGSSAASAIVAGGCALLLEWGIIQGNDSTMYSRKMRSYLIYGARRSRNEVFPSINLGYGIFDLLNIFNGIARIYNTSTLGRGLLTSDENSDYIEEKIDENIFLRIPKANSGGIIWSRIL